MEHDTAHFDTDCEGKGMNYSCIVLFRSRTDILSIFVQNNESMMEMVIINYYCLYGKRRHS